MVPRVESPPASLFTCQVTAWLVEPVTVAENWNVSPVPINAVVGVTVTVMPDSIVTVAVAVALVEACEIAVMVTALGFGTVGGAMYRPVESIVPIVAFPPVIPLTSHVTFSLLLAVLTTAASNCTLPPTDTVVLVMLRVTAGALELGVPLLQPPAAQESMSPESLPKLPNASFRPLSTSSSRKSSGGYLWRTLERTAHSKSDCLQRIDIVELRRICSGAGQ